MPRRVGDRCRAAFRAADEREAVEAERVDDGFEVANERVDGEFGRRPIRETVAAFVSCGAYCPVSTSDSMSERVGSVDCDDVVSLIDRSVANVSPSSVV